MKTKRDIGIMEKIECWSGKKSLQKRISYMRSSLTGKMLCFLAIVILPINILMIVITSFVSSSYEQRIKDSYEYQLNLYSQSVNNHFDVLYKEMKEFLRIDNLVVLTNGSKTDSTLDLVHFNSELAESDIWNHYSGMFYIQDKNKDRIAVTAVGHKYSLAEKNQLENMLGENTDSEGTFNGETLFYYNEQVFFKKTYNYKFFSIGILLDAQNVLEQYSMNSEKLYGTLLLTDSDGKIWARLSQAGFENEDGTKQITEWNRKKYMVNTAPIDFGSLQIVHQVARSDYMKGLGVMIHVLYILCGICLIAIPILYLLMNRLVVKPLKELCLAMEEVENGNLEYQIDGKNNSLEMDFLYYSFNHMVEELHHMVTESYEKEIQRLQTDSINIRLQVNQHMLLNFLNTIYSMSCTGRNQEVGEFTLLLMNYFRYVLRQDIEIVTVDEEMNFVQDYLKLQAIRFPDSFHYVYSVEEGAGVIPIPQLIIENFIENTIKYGLILGKEIEILINIRTTEDRLLISICDTGNGMEEARAERLQRGEMVEDETGKHIGIWNCIRRLKYYYGNEQECKITSHPNEGTQIWLEMRKTPLNTEDAAREIRRERRDEDSAGR